VSPEINFAGKESEYRKQYSVYYYLWLKEAYGATDEVLGKVIDSNNVNWAAEHVFGVNYREYRLELKEGVLYSPDFGDKTLLQMTTDAILIREKAGVSLERVESEKKGVIELEQKLKILEPGQVVVLMSPTDPDDSNMGGYSMIYVYEKQEHDQIRATAIRNNQFELQDLQVLSNYLSGVNRWRDGDHLEFVANPFVTRAKFEEVVRECGIDKKDVLPDWVETMSHEIVSAMLHELYTGNIENVKQIFDAFQMSVKTRYETEKRGKREVDWINPLQMFQDEKVWMSVQRQFLMSGGNELMETRGSCGAADVGLKQDDWRNNNVMSDVVDFKEADETYSFDHDGKCVVCKLDPKKLGPCQICEECDQKIRAQVE